MSLPRSTKLPGKGAREQVPARYLVQHIKLLALSAITKKAKRTSVVFSKLIGSLHQQ